MNELGFTPYAERRIRFLEVRKVRGCDLKIYSVVFGENEFDLPRFERGLDLASREIPAADLSAGRPGAGFAILHQGQTGDYVVLSWWDRENELPTRVFLGDGGMWRPANSSESFCVWDMQIIGFERDAYVRSVLRRSGASIPAYLAAYMPSEGAKSATAAAT